MCGNVIMHALCLKTLFFQRLWERACWDGLAMTDRLSWEDALAEFLKPWRESRDVEGAVATGSRVLGTATPHSDIDVHLVLVEGTEWRERGNRIVRGYLIEYFLNPVVQIKQYMEDDRRSGRRTNARMFARGWILFDHRGAVEELCEYAKHQFDLPLVGLSSDETELAKYALWDGLDGLRELQEEGSPGFLFAAYAALIGLVTTYARFLRFEVPPSTRLHRFVTDGRFRERYALADCPDTEFSRLIRDALEERDEERILALMTDLTTHVLDAMGGFDIDAWRLRSNLRLRGSES
jgi:hypothetical protein